MPITVDGLYSLSPGPSLPSGLPCLWVFAHKVPFIWDPLCSSLPTSLVWLAPTYPCKPSLLPRSPPSLDGIRLGAALLAPPTRMTNHPCLPGTEGLPGHETFSAKIRTVPDKLKQSPYFSCSLGLPSLDLGSSITIAHFLIAQKTFCFWYLQKKKKNAYEELLQPFSR